MSYVHEWRRKRRDKVNEIKVAMGCADCGIQHPAVLDFHHIEPVNGDKTKRVSQMISSGLRWQAILEQIDKCIVLCANCHRKRHW
jgi:hypothetical protein